MLSIRSGDTVFAKLEYPILKNNNNKSVILYKYVLEKKLQKKKLGEPTCQWLVSLGVVRDRYGVSPSRDKGSIRNQMAKRRFRISSSVSLHGS